jgi:hypothetical protein
VHGDEPATPASSGAGPADEIAVEHVAVGAPWPEMPLFLRHDREINVPREPPHRAGSGGMAAFWRGVLELGPAIAGERRDSRRAPQGERRDAAGRLGPG